MKSTLLAFALMLPALSACSAAAGDSQTAATSPPQLYNSVYWSDGDSGRLGSLKFRLANIDAPETGSLKQRGGASANRL